MVNAGLGQPVRIAVNGAAGRMGQRLVALISADEHAELVAALEWAQHPRLGEDAGQLAGIGPIGIPLTAELPAGCDVVIDFSTPDGALAIAERCATAGVALVEATTGLSDAQREKVLAISARIPLLWSPSMSMTVNLAMKLAGIAAAALGKHPAQVDVEIIERHHRYKEDAPSGTALKFGQIVSEQLQLTREQHGREGRLGARPAHEIGYHAVRVGDNPGEHTIVFGLLGETLEINVKASNRDCYAHGAIAAAKFLAGKPSGLYGMEDVLEG